MILKFNRKSQGRTGVVEYLLNEREQEGTAYTLRGNPETTKSLIKIITRKHKYLSCGLMFREDEEITDIQKIQIMDAFEKVLFVGLNTEQYNILWVEHIDKGRLELNVVIPRIELYTGNDLDLYSHRRDLPIFDMWKNGINAEYKLADPNDPRRARTMSECANVARSSGSIVANRKDLDETLHKLVQDGQIKNRDQMIELLKTSGYEITRKNSENISVKHVDIGKKALRLRGGIYSENFTSTKGIESLSKERKQRIAEYDNKAARGKTGAPRAIYEKYLQTRANRHQKRYSRPEATYKKESQNTQNRDTNNVDRQTYNEDKERINHDRIRELVTESRRRREEYLERARKLEAELFRSIKEFNLQVQEQLRKSERSLHANLAKAREDVETNIADNARRVDTKIVNSDGKDRSFTERIQKLFANINGRVTNITKSIKGVVDEIKKIKLFKKASKTMMSQERPTINLTPWS